MSELDGGTGNILGHHVKPEDLEKKFEQAQVLDKPPVKKFLEKVTKDEEG